MKKLARFVNQKNLNSIVYAGAGGFLYLVKSFEENEGKRE